MKRLLFLACIVLLALLGAALFVAPAGRGNKVFWTAASGDPVPERFRYAMIASGDCEGMEDRIYLNTHKELQSTDPISTFSTDNTESLLPASCFAHLTDTTGLEARIAATNAVIAAWGDATDLEACTVTVTPDAASVIVELRIRSKDWGTEAFRYRVQDGAATPLEWRARSSLRS